MQPASTQALFDRAVRLWNEGDFHGAHEDWETLWNDEEGARRDWLQGLIQYAAALFHVQRGYYATGFVKLMRSAALRVAEHDASRERIRFDLLRAALGPWHAHAAAVEAGADLLRRRPPWPVIAYADGVVPCPAPGDPGGHPGDDA